MSMKYVVRVKFMGKVDEYEFNSKEEVYDFIESLPQKLNRIYSRIQVFRR